MLNQLVEDFSPCYSSCPLKKCEGGMASRGENNVDAARMASLIVHLYSLRSSCRVQMNGDGSTSSLSSRSTPLPSPNQQRHRRGQLDILVCVCSLRSSCRVLQLRKTTH